MFTEAAGLLTSSQARLAAATTPLRALAASLPTVDDAPLGTPAVHAALRTITSELHALRDALTGHASLPGWPGVVAALMDACAALQPWASPAVEATTKAADGAQPAIAQCVEQVQLWVQAVWRASAQTDDPESPLPPILRALHRAAVRMSASRASAAASAALDAARLGAPPHALHGLLGMLAAACRVACLEQVVFCKALAKLGYVVGSVLVGVVLEGFCTPDGNDAADGAGAFGIDL